MPRGPLLDWLSPASIFVGAMALVLLSTYAGISLARFRKKHLMEDQETSVSAVVGPTTALLAFLLAFTFGLTASRFDAKRMLLLEEINAIGTTFLRTRLIPEPHGAAVRALLQEYVALRVELARHPEQAEPLVRRSGELQELMWPHAAALVEADLKNPDITALFVESLNEMFDTQTKRITVGVFYQMPLAIWIALLAVTIFSMLEVGYLLGLFDRVNWLLILMLSLALSTVIMLIADLDRSGVGGAGFIKVELQPMTDLQQRMQGADQTGAGGGKVT